MLYKQGDILRILPSWVDCCKRHGWSALLSTYKTGYIIEYSGDAKIGTLITNEGKNIFLRKDKNYYIPSNHVELLFPNRFIIIKFTPYKKGEVFHIRPIDLDKLNTLEEEEPKATYTSRTSMHKLVISNRGIKELLDNKHILRF
ncbi:MAG TPA: hypothetical protein PKL44_00505 [Candidatus Dojkabacteria bacterium]|nr:hypothetical protein [Candidatus Dojkabacteria bacterium]